MRLHPNANQIAGLKHLHRLLFRQAHSVTPGTEPEKIPDLGTRPSNSLVSRLWARGRELSDQIFPKETETHTLFQISLTSYCLALSFPTFVFPKNLFFFNGLAGF